MSQDLIENKNKHFFKNIVVVLISNVISLISGIMIGFIVPKIMGVTEYGYYKTFTLYSSYIGVLHFGFIDGIYLKFAGKKYDQLDKASFRCYTRFLFLIEASISVLVIVVSLFLLDTSLFLIVLFLGFNIFSSNIVTYYEFVSQITMQFKRTTIRNVIRCLLNILSVAVLFLLYYFKDVVIHNSIYLVITLSINYLLALWYIVSYREITFGKANSFRKEKDSIFYFFKVGIPLLLSNLVALLVFVVDQQFVNLAFDLETYSLYAFAYNMISLITTVTSAISVVLYPTLKTTNEESVTKNYTKINSYLLMLVAFFLIAYYPLVFVVNHFLPKYNNSLPTFLIVLPGVLISSSISVVKYNYYKAFKLINNYFLKSLFVLILAVVADLIVYLIFKDTKSISIVSIAVLLVWYISVEIYFVKVYKVKWLNNLGYIIAIVGGFYAIGSVGNIYIGFLLYFIFYLLITICFYLKEIKAVVCKINNRKHFELSTKASDDEPNI